MGICESKSASKPSDESKSNAKLVKENPNRKNDIKDNNKNYIIAELYIKDDDVNKDIRILNSYEEYIRNFLPNFPISPEKANENDIKNCEIRINEELIPFKYFHKFKKKGKYIIKYTFNNYLTNSCYIFCDCSNFTNINLSNFNTKNVTIMVNMFSRCSSLENINLSNFNTQNVIDMNCIFSGCKSLTNINLSNFDTRNVYNMGFMFSECSSLKSLDLSNFNTQNTMNMDYMFSECSSLKSLDLSNFDTKKVIGMENMFYNCSSLTSLNLSSFNTEKVIQMDNMFRNCSSLKMEKIITRDKRIIDQYLNDKHDD